MRDRALLMGETLQRITGGTDWTRAVGMLTHKEGVEAFRSAPAETRSSPRPVPAGRQTR
jgi:hypothetical protein